MEIDHLPVLPDEVLSYLTVPEGKTRMLDCTTGEGGHTALFLERYKELTVTGLDRDREIQKKAIERLAPYGERFQSVNCWFTDYLAGCESGSFDCILFDLGISMFHYVESGRGFSFSKDEPLDMRLDTQNGLSAADIVNGYSEQELADVIYRYGEERYSRRIARRICEERGKGEITTSSQLAGIIAQAVPASYRYGRINPATRTFQALRIEVNDELGHLEPALRDAVRALRKGGRLGVITFHSLEDRIVKWFFKGEADKEDPVIRILTKKPVMPSEEECAANNASRSSKLRVVEKVR